MELRDHPLISHHSVPAWPPIWSPIHPENDRKSLKGEIGRLETVLANSRDKCFLVIEHEGKRYIGCLFMDDSNFYAKTTVTLQKYIGRAIKEIGGIDLSFSQPTRELVERSPRIRSLC
jgi:hypothetical protein